MKYLCCNVCHFTTILQCHRHYLWMQNMHWEKMFIDFKAEHVQSCMAKCDLCYALYVEMERVRHAMTLRASKL